MLHARRILIALLAASGLSVTAQESRRDPGAIVLLADSEGHTADGELRHALLDPDPRIRIAAARVAAAGDHRELLANIVGALLREQDGDAGAELVRDALLLGGERDLALIDRQAVRLGPRAVAAKAEWLARTRPQQFLEALPTLADHADAVAPLVEMAATQHPSLRSHLRGAWKGIAAKAKDDKPSRPTARTIDLPKGTVAATLLASGCRSVPDVGEAELLYRPDGRPRKITLTRGGLVAACINALSALARLSFAAADYPVGEDPQTLVVPLHAAYAKCDSQPTDRSRAVHADVDKFVAARLKREIKPDYSRQAMQHRVEGIVEVTARVSEHGCVEHAQVIRTLPYLDVQALLAVTQWGFEPARVERTPVPMQVSIELTFTLK